MIYIFYENIKIYIINFYFFILYIFNGLRYIILNIYCYIINIKIINNYI